LAALHARDSIHSRNQNTTGKGGREELGMTTYGAEPLGGLDGELEVLERVLVVRGVAPREIEPGD
jgi:hypothetical protein